MKVEMVRRWPTNFKVNYEYGKNGQPIIYSNEFKMLISIHIPEYDGDLC